MGFVLGASFFFGMYGRNVTEGEIASQHEKGPANETTKPKKDETDETLAFYTLWLMAFTGILAFATIGLGGATVLLYATGEKQFKFAIRSSIRQSRDMQASINLARAEFTATHRAKIIIQSAYLAFHGGNGFPAQVHFTIVNTGETEATITEYTVQPYIQPTDAAFAPYFEDTTPVIPTEAMTIALGEPAAVIALCDPVNSQRYEAFRAGNAKLFVLGHVSYAASDGIRRTTGFCRVYSEETGDWHVVRDSTYEYAY